MAEEQAYDRQKACYEQNFAQFRGLNEQMNQVPALGMAITGGLWYAAGAVAGIDKEIKFALLLFAGFSNIALILAIYRIRDVLESYLEKIKEFNPDSFASGEPKNPKVPWGGYSMISIYCSLALIAAVMSFTGALWKYWPFQICNWVGVAILIIVLAIFYWRVFKHKKQAAPTGG
jgi:hypothetical protein